MEEGAPKRISTTNADESAAFEAENASPRKKARKMTVSWGDWMGR
jgi:hypothetical protein